MNLLDRAKLIVCDMNEFEANRLGLPALSVQDWPEWAKKDWKTTVDALVAVRADALSEGFATFWPAQAEWSQNTFGSDNERGPIGPLKHLAKEVAEVLQDPTDLMEFVDCLFLIFDSTRRAGFTFEELRDAAWKKLEINKARKWQTPPKGDEAIEHVRDLPPEPDPAASFVKFQKGEAP
jgi:Protein of unknown function (DUF550)